MSSYDLLVGLSSAKLDQALAKLYGISSLRTSVFAGRTTQTSSGIDATISWDVQAAPTFSLRAPTDAEWKGAVKANGNPAQPGDGAFLINLSKLALQVKAAAENLDTTVPLSVICAAQSSGTSVSLVAVAVHVNLSNATELDKFLIKSVLIPGILEMLNKSLEGLKIAPPPFPGVTLSSAAVAVQNDHLLIGFNRADAGTPDLEGTTVPSDPFFVLMSPTLLRLAIDNQVQTNLQGKEFSKSDSSGGGGFSASYDARGRIERIAVSATGSPLKYGASTTLSLTASAGIDLPGGFIVEAGQVVAKAAEDIGKKIIDPDTWNPSKW